MADTFRFKLIGPTGVVYQGPVKEVTAVDADGEFGVRPDHVNFVTSLVSGTITLKLGDGSNNKYRLAGGRTEVKDGMMTVLAAGSVSAVEPDAATELQIAKQKFAQMSFYDPGYQEAEEALRVARVRAEIDKTAANSALRSDGYVLEAVKTISPRFIILRALSPAGFWKRGRLSQPATRSTIWCQFTPVPLSSCRLLSFNWIAVNRD